MAAGPKILVRYIRRLATRREADNARDAVLLNRYISEKDEQAFAALVDRHGPLVFHVCRRVLGDVHDAEDAFQAAFLVLARKAAGIHPREALAAWLHGVARRVALKARSTRARQLRKGQPLPLPSTDPRADPLADLSARELLSLVDAEVRRLPEVYRLPVILCCLEGRSQEEAARQLGWTAGSVKGRLERGRARLHDRLVRRGLTLAAALAATEVSRGAASAVLLAPLVPATVRAALAFAAGRTAGAGVSATAIALAVEAVKCMALARLKLGAALVLAMCLLTAGVLLRKAATAPDTRGPQPPTSPDALKDKGALAGPAALANNERAAPRAEEDVPIEVNGRVLDPTGKPFVGAKLYVGYSIRRFAPAVAPDTPPRQTSYPVRATSEADGRFHFAFTRSELDARWLDDSRPAVIAVAGGFGPDWAEIGETGLSLKLVEDIPVAGRILDAKREPVAGAKILVRNVISDSEARVTRFLGGDASSWYPRSWRGPLPGQPPDVTTDADGRFRLTGLGRDRIVALAVEGPAIPDASITAVARPVEGTSDVRWVKGATFEYVTSPRQRIGGVVRDKATGRPVAGVQMGVYQAHSTTVTDEDGRYEIQGCPKGPGCLVRARPRVGQPYFAASVCVYEPVAADTLTVDVDLVRGIPVSGKVTDLTTQKPPRSAVVEYYPLYPNPHSSKATNGVTMAASSAVIGPDGSYSLVVLPGPGVVCVAASPRNSYAVAQVDDKEFADLVRNGKDPDAKACLGISVGDGRQIALGVTKYNAVSLINPGEKAAALGLDLAVQPSRNVKGAVVGPDSKPLAGVEVVGLTALLQEELLESEAFTVMGLNPRGTRNLVFHDAEKGLAKVVTIRGDEIGPLTVQLDPCGAIAGRLVDKGGKPAPEQMLWFFAGVVGADAAVKTDRDGRFRVALVPGRKYSLGLYGSHRLLGNVGAINVESGQTIDLGDLPLAD